MTQREDMECLVEDTWSQRPKALIVVGRRRDPGYCDWEIVPRPPDTETWRMREMIEAHQDSVWDYDAPWPSAL